MNLKVNIGCILREKPLAMYIFSKDDQQVETLIENVSSGGTCVNDALMHVTREQDFFYVKTHLLPLRQLEDLHCFKF